jgi:hypothetical protein
MLAHDLHNLRLAQRSAACSPRLSGVAHRHHLIRRGTVGLVQRFEAPHRAFFGLLQIWCSWSRSLFCSAGEPVSGKTILTGAGSSPAAWHLYVPRSMMLSSPMTRVSHAPNPNSGADQCAVISPPAVARARITVVLRVSSARRSDTSAGPRRFLAERLRWSRSNQPPLSSAGAALEDGSRMPPGSRSALADSRSSSLPARIVPQAVSTAG